MNRKGLIALMGVAVLVLSFGVAVAHAAKFSTTIVERTFDSNPGDTDDVFVGDLQSPSRKCLPGRTVKMFKQTPSGFKLVDTDITSRHGAWGLRGNLAGQPNLKFTVAKERLNHGATTCKADTLLFP